MNPIKIIGLIFKFILAIGMTYGYAELIRQMAFAARKAHQHNIMSGEKFNSLLWNEAVPTRRNSNSRGQKQ